MTAVIMTPIDQPGGHPIDGARALYSSLARMSQVASKLPRELQALYQAHFVEGMTPEEVCARLALTQEEFERQRGVMLRNIRAGVGAALLGAVGQNQSS